MPHISIKHFPKALTQEQKNYLSEMITITIQDVFQCDKSVISIATEAIEQSDWGILVYEPEIEKKQKNLVKKPNY
ncbi:tautomerase family protein [Vibrio sagamiensis]|uniref:4-oxalocrotonate tautomerase-like domain-containing protein n=1 Tax=Vibrio sagamiensis NBRC 104589 TaxID=1219064 RepID=A0A511QJH0_9VIBR|nr:tautomerase family protein [Vibrio sagamiensis]GEM77478.1 hypothetical protein VSA01S_35900 [Vibrio sagamiensis NBRC 104589]